MTQPGRLASKRTADSGPIHIQEALDLAEEFASKVRKRLEQSFPSRHGGQAVQQAAAHRSDYSKVTARSFTLALLGSSRPFTVLLGSKLRLVSCTSRGVPGASRRPLAIPSPDLRLAPSPCFLGEWPRRHVVVAMYSNNQAH